MFSCANKINEIFRGDCGGRPPSSRGLRSAQGLRRMVTAGARAGRREGAGEQGRRSGRLPADSGKIQAWALPHAPRRRPRARRQRRPSDGGARAAALGAGGLASAAVPVPSCRGFSPLAAPAGGTSAAVLPPGYRTGHGIFWRCGERETQPCPSPNFLPSESVQPRLGPRNSTTWVMGLT